MSLELTRRKALGSAAVAAAMLGLRITSEAQAQETQVPATPVALGPATPPEADVATDWFTENKNFAMDRNASDSAINSSNVGDLAVAWHYALDAAGGYGMITMNPLVSNGVVYIQDMANNVHAVDFATGEQIWRTDFNTTTGCFEPALVKNWCPSSRDNVQLTADYYGVWIQTRYSYEFSILGSGTTVRRDAVMRLEPKVS